MQGCKLSHRYVQPQATGRPFGLGILFPKREMFLPGYMVKVLLSFRLWKPLRTLDTHSTEQAIRVTILVDHQGEVRLPLHMQNGI